MTKRIFSLILTVAIIFSLCSLLFSSCSAKSLYSEGDGELLVLCTVFAPFDFARNIGSDKVTVTLLQDRGSDLHSYTPTAATLDALAKADVFIYIGGSSDEKWVDNAISASGNTSLLTVSLIDSVEQIHAELENDWSDHSHKEHDDHDDHDHGSHSHGGDEHIWTSLKNAKSMVAAIESAFISKDPGNADTYRANAAEYTQKLDNLDREYESAIASAEKRPIVFADRFPFVYLMHDYRIPYVAAFSGCSTEVNSSIEMQISLIKAVKYNSLCGVIVIEGNDKSLAEAVAEESGCKILTLNSMQSITRAEIEAGADYIEIMRSNLLVIKEVLG